MSGSPTRSSQGPPGTRRAALCVAALAALAATALSVAAIGAVAAGCASSTATPLPSEAPGGPPTPDPLRLRAALAADAGAGPVTGDAFFADALRAAGLTPPVEGRFTFPAFGTGRSIAAGLIPGRRASLRDTLVVAVAAGSVGRAALLEAARLLAARATFVPSPQRSVLVAFPTADPMGAEGADAALARVLALPLWDAAAVRRVVLVGGGADTTAARAAAQERGLHFTVVSVTPAAATDDVEAARAGALAAYAALLDAARRPPPPIVTVVPSPDSLLPPPVPGGQTPRPGDR